MQIDFHHAVTYVTARIAGFSHEEADTIAYSSQYVDDASSKGVVFFDNHAMYARIRSAHKTLDLQNLVDADNHLVWLPFHFLPGNGGKKSAEEYDGKFIGKIVCRPDSPPAKDMVQAAIHDKHKPYGLHRLGIAMHVYADTWAHQGFAGVIHEINEVKNAQETGHSGVYSGYLQNELTRFLQDTVPPLGHGRAREFPDMPFLAWEYQDGMGNRVARDNAAIFTEAADAMCKAMQWYLGKPQVGLDQASKDFIIGKFRSIKEKDEDKRHQQWLDSIEKGEFGFGSVTIAYADDGPNSWKAKALGFSQDLPVHSYNDKFLESDWKLFHDALQLHQLTVLHDILPKYGICA